MCTAVLISSKNSPALYRKVVIGVLSGSVPGVAAGILTGWMHIFHFTQQKKRISALFTFLLFESEKPYFSLLKVR